MSAITERPRQRSWRRFLVGAALTLAVILAGGAYLLDRFRLGIDDQVHSCLPPYHWFLIDTYEREIMQGQLVAFYATERMHPYFQPEQIVIKVAAGVPGDRIEVSREETRVNGAHAAGRMGLFETLGMDQWPQPFTRHSFIVPAGQYLALGRSLNSFDSRYWGTLPAERVIGRAYALF